jgi:hypothetical protein
MKIHLETLMEITGAFLQFRFVFTTFHFLSFYVDSRLMTLWLLENYALFLNNAESLGNFYRVFLGSPGSAISLKSGPICLINSHFP